MEQTILTQRQEEILELVAKGCSNSDVGRMLGIATNTVKSHMAIILQRLEVANRTEATTLYKAQCASAEEGDPQFPPSMLTVHLSCDAPDNDQAHTVFNELARLLGCYEILDVVISRDGSGSSPYDWPQCDFQIALEACAQDKSRMSLTLYHAEPVTGFQHLLLRLQIPVALSTPSSLFKYVIQAYQKILLSCASFHGIRKAESRLYALLGNFDSHCVVKLRQAAKDCDTLLNTRPGWALPHAFKAIQIYQGLTRGSLPHNPPEITRLATHAQQALSLDQHSSLAHLAFAQYGLISSDLTLAKSHLLKSLELNPCLVPAAQLLGQVYAFEGDTEKGIETFKRLLLWFPDSETNGNCFGSLALAYYCSGDLANSQQTALRALMYPDAPKAPMLLTLISIAERTNNPTAIDAYKQRLQEYEIDAACLADSIKVAARIVPAALINDYVASINRAGLTV